MLFPIGYKGFFLTNNTPNRSTHAGGGATFAMGDGRVTSLNASTDLGFLESLASRARGEVWPANIRHGQNAR